MATNLTDANNVMERLASVKSMQLQLMQAAFDTVTEQDVREIVQSQVAKAKAGDARAIDFMMKYLLGQDGSKTVINNKQEIIVGSVAEAARTQQVIEKYKAK